MLDPGLEPHQSLYVSVWMTWLSFHASCQEVSKCCTRGEPGGFCFIEVMKHASEGIHRVFETKGRHHQKFKTGVSVSPQK